MGQKVRKRTALRNAEYYDQQELFDSLYSKSKNNEVFGRLMEVITSPENIKLAYRNIKRNDGSKTAGTDGMTIAHFSKWENSNSLMLSRVGLPITIRKLSEG